MKASNLITAAYNNRITIIFAGVGGTGSLLLHTLARIAVALQDIRHIELVVHVFDADIVTPSNRGRQCYTEYDIGRHKSVIITERINRSYGLQWIGVPMNYPMQGKTKGFMSNVIISCTDNIKSRRNIENAIETENNPNHSEHGRRFAYWLDCGNTFDSGNVILTDLKTLPKVSGYLARRRDSKVKATCSLAVALGRQHFMVNGWASTVASTILWDLLYDHRVNIHAAFYNVKTLQIRTIKASQYENQSIREGSTLDAVQAGE